MVVMNDFSSAGWGPEIKCPFPDFVDGQDFRLKISCGAKQISLSVNGEDLSESFPYRGDIADAMWIGVYGGINGFSWNKLKGMHGTMQGQLLSF